MTVLHNEMIIDAPMEKIWDALATVDALDKYDPTVARSQITSKLPSGVGAARKVEMKDGKNWFEERCILSRQNEILGYELTACSFPIHELKHLYSFEKTDDGIKVKQMMQYRVKFGLLGKILDALVMRRKTNNGIKEFLSGLKRYAEN